MRLLVWLALAAIVFYLGRAFLRRLQGPVSSEPPRSNSTASGPESAAEPMRQCTHCRAYFPASEAVIESPDRLFCSEEHRQRHHSSEE
jgi:uncharacterized protein